MSYGRDSRVAVIRSGLQRLLRLLAIAWVVIIFSGCAIFATRQYNYAAAFITTIRVPFHAQESARLCGLACIEMLNLYYHRDLADTERERLCVEAKEQGGISGQSLKDALVRCGYFAVVFQGDLDGDTTGLLCQLKRGRPVIVLLRPDRAVAAHYCIVVGYEFSRDEIILIDPSEGKRNMTREDFNRVWRREDHFALLAVPTAEIPTGNPDTDAWAEP